MKLSYLMLAIATFVSISKYDSSAFAIQDQDSAEQNIAAVENGLYQRVRVVGEKPWTIAQRMKHYNVPGLSVAVVDDYKVAWAKAYGVVESGRKKPVTIQTAFQAASISKSVNGLAVMRLADQEKIDLKVDINSLLTSWSFPYDKKFGNEKITMENLLSHTAGTTVHGFGGYTSANGLPSLLQILNGTEPANSGAVRSFRGPNKGYQYSGGGTVISQLILQDVTKMPYEKIMKKTVLDPIGMNDSFYAVTPQNRSRVAFAHRANGNRLTNRFNYYPEQAPAGLWTTPTDLAKFIVEIQKAIAGKSTSILSAEIAKTMLTPHLQGTNSAMGFFVEDRNSSKYFQHGGSNEGFKCQYFGSFDSGDGVVVMVNSDNFDIIPEVIQSVATVYEWPNFYNATVRKQVEVTNEDILAFQGVYKIADGARLRITVDGNEAFLGTGYGNRIQMYPESKTSFFLRTADQQIHFKEIDGVKSFDMVRNGTTTNAVKQKPSLAFAMLDRIRQKNVDAGIKWFEENQDNDDYAIAAYDLNEAGYVLFNNNRILDAIKVFRFAIENFPESKNARNRLTEETVNMTGYEIMGGGNTKDAIEIFKFNVDLYPDSFNVYDSLGEGLLADKQYKESLKNYKRSVELNPDNAGGKAAIKKIESLLKK